MRAIWLVILVVALIAFYNFYNKSYVLSDLLLSVNGIFNKGTIASSNDPLISGCIDDFNICRNIAESKYDISITLINYEKFYDEESADKFFTTWKGPFQLYSLSLEVMTENVKFPIVLLATKTTGPAGMLPYVTICDKSGALIDHSKVGLLCG